MPDDRLWTMGNRVPSQFVRDLEMARRKAEAHRKATPAAWQDYVALRKLVDQAVGKLLILEDERESFTRNLTIDPPPSDMKPEDADALCQDAVAGSLAHIAHDAFKKGWRDGAVFRAMIAYGEHMLVFQRRAMGRNPQGALWADQTEAGTDEPLPPFGTAGRKGDSENK